jgi:hypothetical protein
MVGSGPKLIRSANTGAPVDIRLNSYAFLATWQGRLGREKLFGYLTTQVLRLVIISLKILT